jgi:hypothetical protein
VVTAPLGSLLDDARIRDVARIIATMSQELRSMNDSATLTEVPSPRRSVRRQPKTMDRLSWLRKQLEDDRANRKRWYGLRQAADGSRLADGPSNERVQRSSRNVERMSAIAACGFSTGRK